MKIVFLVECDKEIDNLDLDYKVMVVETNNLKEKKEINLICNSINKFSKSNYEILFVKFSGKEEISSLIGDEFSEMIVTLSSNKKSLYYTSNLVNSIKELIDIFKGENKIND